MKEGNITGFQYSSETVVDKIVSYLLENPTFKSALKSFPDPRNKLFSSVPMNVILLATILQILNDEHSIVNSPYMLNDAKIMAQLGYTVKIIQEGFNDQNKYERRTPWHGEVLKHILLKLKPEEMVNWFNKCWSHQNDDLSPGKTRLFIMDGCKINVPEHNHGKYQRSGKVKNKKGEYEYGYKIVWIQEIIDRKTIIRGMKIVPVNVHDVEVGKQVVEDFDFPENSTLIMDRGFLDGKWINDLKQKRNIDVCIPLKKGMTLTEMLIYNHSSDWKDHPTRKKQQIRKISEEELDWEEYSVFKSGILIRFKNKNNRTEHIPIVHTGENLSGQRVLEIYTLRPEIEESHRQLKTFLGFEKLPSGKYSRIVYDLIMGAISYNLFNLFLNSEKCDSLESYSIKLFRQQKEHVGNKEAEVIIYTETEFGIINSLDFLKAALKGTAKARERLSHLVDHGGFLPDSS